MKGSIYGSKIVGKGMFHSPQNSTFSTAVRHCETFLSMRTVHSNLRTNFFLHVSRLEIFHLKSEDSALINQIRKRKSRNDLSLSESELAGQWINSMVVQHRAGALCPELIVSRRNWLRGQKIYVSQASSRNIRIQSVVLVVQQLRLKCLPLSILESYDSQTYFLYNKTGVFLMLFTSEKGAISQ